MAGFLRSGVVNLRGVVEIICFAHHPAPFPPGRVKLNVSKVAHRPLHGCLKECFVSGGCEPPGELILFAFTGGFTPPARKSMKFNHWPTWPSSGGRGLGDGECIYICITPGGLHTSRSMEPKAQLSFAIRQSYVRQQSNIVSHPQYSGKG